MDMMAELWAAVSAEVEARRLPGAVIAVTRHGTVRDVRAVGHLDPDRGRPMREDAIFRIYSMTKVFTALAALTMAAEHRLRLRDPVAAWLPGFADIQVLVDGTPRAPKRPPTLADLLRQSAGIGGGFHTSAHLASYYARAGVRKYEHTAATHTLDDVVANLARQPLAADPGTAWEYGMAMDVLGRVLEIADGSTLDEIVERRVCRPLGLRDTGFHVAAADHDRVAQPFAQAPATPKGLVTHKDRPGWLSAGSGGYATAADFATLLCAITPDQEGGLSIPALGPCTRALFVDQIGALAGTRPDYIPGKGYGFSYGLHVPSSDPAWAAADPSAHTVGWLGRAATSFVYDLPSGAGAVLMTQCYGRAVHYRDLVREIVTRQAEAWT